MIWTPRCVKPRFLAAVGALTAVERALLETDRQVQWGRARGSAEADYSRRTQTCRPGWSAVGARGGRSGLVESYEDEVENPHRDEDDGPPFEAFEAGAEKPVVALVVDT